MYLLHENLHTWETGNAIYYYFQRVCDSINTQLACLPSKWNQHLRLQFLPKNYFEKWSRFFFEIPVCRSHFLQIHLLYRKYESTFKALAYAS